MSLPQINEVQPRPIPARQELARAEAALRAKAMLGALFSRPEQTRPEDFPETQVDNAASEPVIPEVATPAKNSLDFEKSKPQPGKKIQITRSISRVAVGVAADGPSDFTRMAPLGFDTVMGYGDVLPGFFGEDQDWVGAALCAQVDGDMFFPEKGGSTKEAKKICAQCEVRADCLEYALENNERFGIWGGLSERERRRLLRRGKAGNKNEEYLLVKQPYARIVDLVDMLETESSEGREGIEDILHEDEKRLVKFVQAVLGTYKSGALKPVSKPSLDRLFRYYKGEDIGFICQNGNIQRWLRQDIENMTDYFDKLTEDGVDPLTECWSKTSRESELLTLGYIAARPHWQKEAMLAERQEAAV